MERRRVVITGLGAVTPLGLTAGESWRAVREGVCGIGPITGYDPAGMKVRLAAEVKGFSPEALFGKPEAKRMGRFTQFALAAAREALADSGFRAEDADPRRCGVIVSSGIGGIGITEEEHDRGLARGWDRVSPFFIPTGICNMGAGRVAIDAGFRGMCCGGAEAALTPLAVGGFTSMKALSQSTDPSRASIPFDAERSGFVMGEGAGILLLEELDHALARGAKIYAEVGGYGATCDAYHMTAPRPDGSGGAEAMAMALRDGGAAAEDVDYINAHGTSTHLNDAGETAAIKTVFGGHAYRLAVSSTKSMTGHMLGAAGAVEAIFTALALRYGYIPATINYQVPDPECDLDVTPGRGREAELRCAISNSLGFGGHNGSLLFKRWEA